MKKVTFILFCLLLPFLAEAQTYQVYSVKGDIVLEQGGKKEKVIPGMKLLAGSVLTIPEQSRLVVLDESKKELYTVKIAANDELGKLIVTNGNTTQQLTDSYMAFIKQKITDSGDPKEKNYKQSAATSYRETDSLLLKILVPKDNTDSTQVKNVDKKQ